MSMHETDIRRLQGREDMSASIRYWDKHIARLQDIRTAFNLAASYTQNPKGDK